MKFWQLLSLMRNETEIVQTCLQSSQWVQFYHWYLDFNALIQRQDRAKLDTPVPDNLVRSILAKSGQRLYYRDGWLRSRRSSDADIELELLAAFDRFGDVIDDVFEYGSCKV